MIRIIIPILILTLFGCGEKIDKLKKTVEIVTVYDKKKDGKFSVKASISSKKSELIITLNHKPFQAYYTNALYEIILELHKNKISYDSYKIKDSKGREIWVIEDSKIGEITKTVNHSKKIMKLLDNKKYNEFISYFNLKALGVSDSTFLRAIEKNPVYPNTEYKGFSILKREFDGQSRDFMFFFFMNKELKENMIVINPEDQLVYGLEY